MDGSSSCNGYGGSFQLTGNTVAVGPLAATRRGCESAVMNQETRFLQVLQAVNRAELAGDGTLRLAGPAGTITARQQR